MNVAPAPAPPTLNPAPINLMDITNPPHNTLETATHCLGDEKLFQAHSEAKGGPSENCKRLCNPPWEFQRIEKRNLVWLKLLSCTRRCLQFSYCCAGSETYKPARKP